MGLSTSKGKCPEPPDGRRQRLITAGFDLVFLQDGYDIRIEPRFRVNVIDDQQSLCEKAPSRGAPFGCYRRGWNRYIEEQFDEVQIHQILQRIVQKDSDIVEWNRFPQGRRQEV